MSYYLVGLTSRGLTRLTGAFSHIGGHHLIVGNVTVMGAVKGPNSLRLGENPFRGFMFHITGSEGVQSVLVWPQHHELRLTEVVADTKP